MGVEELKNKLQEQLRKLENPEYGVHEFRVWWLPGTTREALGESLIRYETDTWSQGFCTSETCAHWSHDPLQSGSSVFIDCSYIGQSDKDEQMYRLSNGRLLHYAVWSNGRHYNKAIRLAVE